LLLKYKDINPAKFVLAGDFFHSKASKMSSLIGDIPIPYYLSTIEEELAKVNILI